MDGHQNYGVAFSEVEVHPPLKARHFTLAHLDIRDDLVVHPTSDYQVYGTEHPAWLTTARAAPE